jgi:competence protein ComEA
LRLKAESPTPSSRQAAQPNTPTSTRSTSPNRMQDGQKIHVPRKGEASAPALASVAPSRTPRSAPQAAAATPQFPINLNTATAEQLEAIPGIGPVLAQRIIEYRQTHGRFQSVDELLEVRGIGSKRLENMRPYVTVQ